VVIWAPARGPAGGAGQIVGGPNTSATRSSERQTTRPRRGHPPYAPAIAAGGRTARPRDLSWAGGSPAVLAVASAGPAAVEHQHARRHLDQVGGHVIEAPPPAAQERYRCAAAARPARPTRLCLRIASSRRRREAQPSRGSGGRAGVDAIARATASRRRAALTPSARRTAARSGWPRQHADHGTARAARGTPRLATNPFRSLRVALLGVRERGIPDRSSRSVRRTAAVTREQAASRCTGRQPAQRWQAWPANRPCDPHLRCRAPMASESR